MGGQQNRDKFRFIFDYQLIFLLKNIPRKFFNSAIHAINTQRNPTYLRQGAINKQAISIAIIYHLCNC